MWQQNYTEWATACRYNVTLESGKFEVIKDSIAHLADDRRLQVLLIAFAFGAFIEGAVGFATPVAVAATMLTRLGFTPLYAAVVCLLADAASVSQPKHSLILTFGRRRAAYIAPFWAP